MGHGVSPDRLVDLLALEHLALGLGEKLEHLELPARQVHAAAGHEGLELVRPDLELPEHQRRLLGPGRRALAAPHDGLHSGEHLLRVAGLRDGL
jgi:hypothetical protein